MHTTFSRTPEMAFSFSSNVLNFLSILCNKRLDLIERLDFPFYVFCVCTRLFYVCWCSCGSRCKWVHIYWGQRSNPGAITQAPSVSLSKSKAILDLGLKIWPGQLLSLLQLIYLSLRPPEIPKAHCHVIVHEFWGFLGLGTHTANTMTTDPSQSLISIVLKFIHSRYTA